MDDKWPRDAFLPFNAGPRACLGRRFTETESVAVIAMIVSRYKIDIKEDPKFAHETADQRRRRVLRSKPGLSMTPLKVPLVFRRRQET
ncbi:hypothetical protein PHLCEN_2v8345 [Hermanssonia centrifuga]|uniref:Cytochrome P450 n=1 Tax=Hermanssonia centrifuga TaxID=98765 RepID=A0A2R6NTV6_9APHY|nr:hypothetical protein PHLCEN_2v8345 [Hermanssonia centrifuga]